MDRSAIDWLPWSRQAFDRARAEARPVLLSIVARWCRHSARMDAASYADPRVADLVRRSVVPVRVDADRRPDISQRYELGGCPTTAFLTPDGEILGGGTYVDADRLCAVLPRIVQAFKDGRHERRIPAATGPTADRPRDDAGLLEQVRESFDRQHGGFGDAPKFPHVAPVRLALALSRERGDADWADVAVTTLDAMAWGPLYDERQGGFYRCSRERNWQEPGAEKLLPVNAGLLSLYVEAFELLQLTRYAGRAEDILRYAGEYLADAVHGGWAASQRLEAPAADPRAALPGEPATDRTVYADWNAAMVSAALHAGYVLQASDVSAFAIRSLERVLVRCYRPGHGVAHHAATAACQGDDAVHDEGPPASGLLDDQIMTGLALLDAFEATGNIVYEMLAEELALHALRTMWDTGGGGFVDRVPGPDDVGLLRQPVKPFVSNCHAVTLLARLAEAAGKQEYARHAAAALAAAVPGAAAQGPLAAEYLLAARRLAHR